MVSGRKIKTRATSTRLLPGKQRTFTLTTFVYFFTHTSGARKKTPTDYETLGTYVQRNHFRQNTDVSTHRSTHLCTTVTVDPAITKHRLSFTASLKRESH